MFMSILAYLGSPVVDCRRLENPEGSKQEKLPPPLYDLFNKPQAWSKSQKIACLAPILSGVVIASAILALIPVVGLLVIIPAAICLVIGIAIGIAAPLAIRAIDAEKREEEVEKSYLGNDEPESKEAQVTTQP